MVHQCHRSICIPFIGCGGIGSVDDAVEFMLAWRVAVQLATASLLEAAVMQKIVCGLDAYCWEIGVESIRDPTAQVNIDRQPSNCWLRFAQQSVNTP